MFKRILFSLLAALSLSTGLGTLAGCNTVDGIGKDIQAGGTELRQEAREHRRY